MSSTLFDYYRSDEQDLGLKWTFDAHQLGVVSVAMDPTGQSKWTVPSVVYIEMSLAPPTKLHPPIDFSGC